MAAADAPGRCASASTFLSRLKRVLAFAAGGVLAALAVLTVVKFSTYTNIPLLIRAIWNLIFGSLIVSMQLHAQWIDRLITRRFGMLDTRVGIGLFYFFVGQNGLLVAKTDSPLDEPVVVFSWAVCIGCWVVGVIEMGGPARGSHHVAATSPGEMNTAAERAAPLILNAENLTIAGSHLARQPQVAAAVWSATVAAASGGGTAGDALAAADRQEAGGGSNPFLRPGQQQPD